MKWDHELEYLTETVIETLGQDVFDGALARALEETIREGRPLPPGHLLAELAAEAGGSASTYDVSSLPDALKLELRRLLTPH